MDDIKLFANNENELEAQIQKVRTYSEDIGVEFVIGKCALLIMKSGKRQMTEEMELPNQLKVKFNSTWNTGSGHHQTSGNKRKNLKRISQENEETTRN